ncbi:MAG: hypothetical protein KC466_09130, partial [Myxococcales bacterium]|nr:hypothetical protein [Myxococcales bacterium]
LEGLQDVSLALEFLGAGDAPLGDVTLGPIQAAEWLPYERTDPVPVGTARARFTARAAGEGGDRGFYDLLKLIPVRR